MKWILIEVCSINIRAQRDKRQTVLWHGLDNFEDVLWVCGGWSYPVGYMRVAHITRLKITWSRGQWHCGTDDTVQVPSGTMSPAHSMTWWATMFSARLYAWRCTTKCRRKSFLPVAVKLFKSSLRHCESYTGPWIILTPVSTLFVIYILPTAVIFVYNHMEWQKLNIPIIHLVLLMNSFDSLSIKFGYLLQILLQSIFFKWVILQPFHITPVKTKYNI